MKQKTTLREPRKGKHNIFRKVSGRSVNYFYDFFLGFFLGFSSWPSSIIEVFMRRQFGERYFTLFTGLSIFTLMMIIWYSLAKYWDAGTEISWGLFAFIYLGQSIRHRLEIKKFGSTYDFDRYSISEGYYHEFWNKIIGNEYYGIKITHYRFYVYLEPLLPFLVGLFFFANPFTRIVGTLIMISSLFFCLRHFAKTHTARNHILDDIDDMICQQHHEDVLLEQLPAEETKGLWFPMELPQDRDLRQKLSDYMKRDYEIDPDDDNDNDASDNEVLAYS